MNVEVLKARAKLLQKYLCDEQKELQALYALQALVVTLEQPASKSQAGGMGRDGAGEGGSVMESASTPERLGGHWTAKCSDGWFLTSVMFVSLPTNGRS